jgi:subtilisin family serine protease
LRRSYCRPSHARRTDRRAHARDLDRVAGSRRRDCTLARPRGDAARRDRRVHSRPREPRGARGRRRARAHGAAGLCTAEIPAAALERVAAVRGVTAIRAAAPIETETSQSVPATGATLLRGAGPSFAGLAGQGVMVGAVDTGVDYDHGDFLDATGHTRFIAIWDQTTPGTGDAEHPYGTMWTAAQLDAGLSNETDLDGHGTHVMGILGGDGSQTGGAVPAYTYAGMAPRADLAFVKTEFSTTSVVDAVLWLFERAAERGENSVVNLSLGTQYGPHDGTSDFEQGLSELAGPGRIIVKSAGNDRGLARHAGTNATAIGASVTLSVSGSAQSRSFAIDGYYDASEMIDVEVRTPSGAIIGPIALGDQSAMYPGSPTPNGDVYLSNDSLDTGRRNIYLEVTASSVTENMNGTWTFLFTGREARRHERRGRPVALPVERGPERELRDRQPADARARDRARQCRGRDHGRGLRDAFELDGLQRYDRHVRGHARGRQPVGVLEPRPDARRPHEAGPRRAGRGGDLDRVTRRRPEPARHRRRYRSTRTTA